MEKGIKKVHVFISGKVHGVFFRAGIRDLASNLGINGFVKNLPDGRVEAVFEGNEGSVNEMIQFCRKGPSGAEVTDIKVFEEKPENSLEDFEILY